MGDALMERIVIRKVANGATVEFGRYVTRQRESMFGHGLFTERTVEYGPPKIFLPSAGDGVFWPPEAPPAGTVSSIYGDTTEDGSLTIMEFGLEKSYGGGPKIIVGRARIEGLAQALADATLTTTAEA